MKTQLLREAREKVQAIKLTHQHFQVRKNAPLAKTVSFNTRMS